MKKMGFLEQIKIEQQKRKAEKKQALRRKNAQLRKEGKDPLAGWGQMMDTGAGGFNKANPIDTKVYFGEKQKRIASETQDRKKEREKKFAD
jgi:hypothetical protein